VKLLFRSWFLSYHHLRGGWKNNNKTASSRNAPMLDSYHTDQRPSFFRYGIQRTEFWKNRESDIEYYDRSLFFSLSLSLSKGLIYLLITLTLITTTTENRSSSSSSSNRRGRGGGREKDEEVDVDEDVDGIKIFKQTHMHIHIHMYMYTSYKQEYQNHSIVWKKRL